MKKTTPTCANVVVLSQMLNLIPRGLLNRHARETGVEARACAFSVLSHLPALLFAQLSHAMGLNDFHAVVCRHALGGAGTDRSAGPVEILWNSIRAVQSDRRAGHRLSTGIRAYQDMIQLDSIDALF